MKAKVIFPIIVLILIVLFTLTVNDSYFFNKAICKEKKALYTPKFNGIVVNKFLDSTNHRYQTLLLRDSTSQNILKIYFINEKSKFYLNVKKGDYIRKESGSLIISNMTTGIIDTLKFDCRKVY